MVTRKAERAIRPLVRLGESPKRRARLWRGQRFILRADVSQFYPSLYTHAIPWALHTKKTAKAKKGQTAGDEIDAAVRACSSGQTSGIPIGPDSSLVVAEIVMTAVDAAFAKRVKRLRAFRYLDDYEVAFRSRAEAEEAHGHLESALAEYELVANPSKTEVVELPQPLHATWPSELARFPIRTQTPTQTLNDTVDLFSRAAEIASTNPQFGALMYVLRRSLEIEVSKPMWRTFQALVWTAVSVEPTTMAVALDLLSVKAK